MTFLQTLGPGSTLIAPAYLHAALREELLKTRSGMLGLKLRKDCLYPLLILI